MLVNCHKYISAGSKRDEKREIQQNFSEKYFSRVLWMAPSTVMGENCQISSWFYGQSSLRKITNFRDSQDSSNNSH